MQKSAIGRHIKCARCEGVGRYKHVFSKPFGWDPKAGLCWSWKGLCRNRRQGESAMIAWTVHSQTAGKACQCQTCGQSKIAACAALERAPKLINPQLWMARYNICAAHFDLECVSKTPECAISGGAAQFLRHKARPRVCLKNSLIRNFGRRCAISASSTLDLALLSLRVSSLN